MKTGDYEHFCQNSDGGSFTQSVNWAKVKENWKSEFIVANDEEGNIVGTILILVKKIPLLNTALLYAPRGPVCDMHDIYILKALFEQVVLTAKKYNAYMLKIDPLIDEKDAASIDNLKRLGFVYHPKKVGYDNIQCRENYIIDINGRTAEELFESFKPKCRYNIRLAVRKGVACGFYGAERLDDFMKLMQATSNRDGFKARSKEYFERLLKAFDGKARLCMCYYGDTPLSGALFIDYAKTISYVYGCSSDNMRNFMPNYLMQWTMIKYAADNGCRRYDFCGIPYWYDENRPNYGVYKFKQGFNGSVKTWAGEFDYPFRNNLYKCAEIIAKIKKHI